MGDGEMTSLAKVEYVGIIMSNFYWSYIFLKFLEIICIDSQNSTAVSLHN